MAQVFVYPIGFDFEALARANNAARPPALCVIRNSRLDPEWAQVERASFDVPHDEQFDPAYMRPLFELGADMAAKGYPGKTRRRATRRTSPPDRGRGGAPTLLLESRHSTSIPTVPDKTAHATQRVPREPYTPFAAPSEIAR
jgi:hypothetical protein